MYPQKNLLMMHDKIPSSIVPTFLLMMSTHVPAHLDSYVVVLKRRLAKYADSPDYKIYELLVICLMVSDSKLWEIIFEVNFSFFSQNMTRNWTFDKFNLLITSEASFKEG